MLNVPEDIQNFYDKEIGSKKIRLEFYQYDYQTQPVYVLTNENITYESLELNEGISTEQNIRYGQCFSSKFTIELFGLKDKLGYDVDFINWRIKAFLICNPNNGEELYPQNGIYPFNLEENIYPGGTIYEDSILPLFVGYITESKLKDNRDNRVITAYDVLQQRLTRDCTDLFWNDLIKGHTAKYIREKILTWLNIPFENKSLANDDKGFQDVTFQNNKNIKINARQALESILEICGCFGHIDRYGIFRFITLAKTYYNYPALVTNENIKYPTKNLYLGLQRDYNSTNLKRINDYKLCRYGENSIAAITGVTFIKSNNLIIDEFIVNNENIYISKGNAYLEYFADGLPVGDYISHAVLQQIKDIKYYPYTLECAGRPYLEVGDYIRIWANNEDKDFIDVPILSRTLKGIQSLMDTFEAKGKEKRNEYFRI